MTQLEHMFYVLQACDQLMNRFPGTTLAEDRREEAREKQREAEEREFNQIMAPLVDPLAALKAAADTLKERSKMIPYRTAATDTENEAQRILDALDDAEKSIKRSIKDAVEV